MADDIPEGFEAQEWAYMGRVRVEGGELGHKWQKPDGSETILSAKGAPKHAYIGGRYRVLSNPAEGTVFVRSAERVHGGEGRFGLSVDQELANRWRVDSMFEQTKHDQARLEAKQAKDNVDLGGLTLGELREMYRKRRGVTLRQPLLAMILAYVTE